MSQTMAPRGPDRESDHLVDLDRHGGEGGAGHGRAVGHWLRHFFEMVVAMMLGMGVGIGIFTSIVGVSYKQSLRQHPTAALIVMAVSMAVPMVAWMRFRRHTWRNSLEMGAAMLLPAVPFLACLWAHAFDTAPNGPYMTVSTVAMVALMLYRWDVYSGHHPARRLRAPSVRGGEVR